MMILMKVADISNEARPLGVAEPWLDCLLSEFFNQVGGSTPYSVCVELTVFWFIFFFFVVVFIFVFMFCWRSEIMLKVPSDHPKSFSETLSLLISKPVNLNVYKWNMKSSFMLIQTFDQQETCKWKIKIWNIHEYSSVFMHSQNLKYACDIF